jgi:uncharacterized protein (DUF1330 family)
VGLPAQRFAAISHTRKTRGDPRLLTAVSEMTVRWTAGYSAFNWESFMKSHYAMTLLAGIAIGAIALQGLHAQGAKKKAYTVSEIEILNPSAQAAYLPVARKAIEAAHGRALGTAGGRVVQIEGTPAPKNVGIVEWDSLDDAVAFYKSKAWTDLAPDREKATKVTRRYVVEAEK